MPRHRGMSEWRFYMARSSLLFLVAVLLPQLAFADVLPEKTESPFFLVTSEVGEVDVLPLKSTKAEVVIAGTIAEVKVTQLYHNRGSIPLEAIYVFPGSTRAAVHGMKMRIGDRIRVAKIKEKNSARAEYAAAKRDGKSATLLEQQRPNVFQMNVANVMPGDEIEVELQYTELLTPTEGVYQFVYPTVVGPRYSSPTDGSGQAQTEKWVENPYTTEGETPTYSFGLQVIMAAGMPIQRVNSTSHTVHVTYGGADSAKIVLDPAEQFAGNKDFILNYKLQGEMIQSGMLLFDDSGSEATTGQAKENFFLLMAQPPKRVTPELMPSREYIFIVDVSGSMHGFPLDVSKELLRNLVTTLRPQDSFNVVLFAGASALFSEQSVPGTQENINAALQLISRQQGGGGTELLPALTRALAIPSAEGVSRSVVLITDGYISAETRAFDLIRQNMGTANVFTFGIGSSVNRFLLEGLARIGKGEQFVVTRAEEARSAAERFKLYIASPVLTDIKIQFEGFDVSEVQPLEQPDLFAERPLLVFGKWRGQPTGKAIITGKTGAGTYHNVIDVRQAHISKELSALRSLWARDRIATLSDYNSAQRSESLVAEITSLGLRYSLLTEFTSFIAVDELVRNPKREVAVVNQPLPLPEGVSNLAVGGSIPSVPEPEFYALLTIVMLSLAYAYRRGLV
jgi:Ca-activated chloride channel family protein